MSEEQTNLYREAWDRVIERDEIVREALVKQMFHDMGKTLGFTHDYMPERILKSGDATIVFWEDGTKTVVKRSPDEPDNEHNAFLAALGIRVYGSNSALKRIIRDYTVVQKPKKAKDACPIDKPCEKSTVEHDLDALNEQAKKQYEEYLAADKWTCPQCGRQYHWQKNDEGRYAFCPKCQLASKDKA